MQFEEIESVWALQQPVKTSPDDLPALRRALMAKLNLRKRLLILAGAGTIVGLVIIQVLFYLNLRVMRVEDQWLSFSRLVLNQTVNLLIVLELARIFLRHRQLARGRAESVRDVVSLALASVEAEMADYRLGWWGTVVLMAQSVLSVYLNRAVPQFRWEAFGVRAGLIVAVYGLIGLLVWRHYRRKLEPERERLKVTLSQLKDAGD